LPDALGALIGQSLAGVIEQAERTLSGASALWLGESRF
jgi:protease-4